MGRRGLFRGMFATPVAVAARAFTALVPPPMAAPLVGAGSLGELVTAALRNRTSKLAESVMRNNAILRHLQRMN